MELTKGEMNLRKAAYFALVRLRGQALGTYYERFLREDQNGIPPDTTKRLLVQMLAHCKRSVPYYAEVMRDLGGSFYENPEQYLRRFPILTKGTIRSRFDELKSSDLPRRRWYYNTSGGSTGEPVRFIQDWDFVVQSGAIKLLYSKLAGREIGECEIRLWGSIRDIIQGSEGWKAALVNKLTNTIIFNAFRMTPEKMREFIAVFNAKRPKLILAYVQAIYELARFAEREGIEVVPQSAIMTSAGTLYSFMREKIQDVFQCRVFNRYGSREVGDVACERPGYEGLWVAPWGYYVEIVDSEGNRVPDGTEGELLVTSLTNFAMPLIRYRIGDLGVLSPMKGSDHGKSGQVLETVLGRTVDNFKTRNGVLGDGIYFMFLLYFRDWVSKYQVIQKDFSWVVFKIVKSGPGPQQAELDEIVAKTRLVMGSDCEVTFEFVDDIPASGSGKYRYTISEVQG
jgi:phenylacetate-CoA ligase